VILAAPADRLPLPSTSGAEPALRLHDLSKRFRVRRGLRETLRHPGSATWVHAVQHVSCDVQPGEFFGLLGPNGAGKTTLFKMLATLTSPDEGWATVHGVDVMKDPRAVRRMIAPVAADERGLHWRLSALENLRLFATLYALRGSELQARIDEVLGVVGLRGAERRTVGTYSSGMRQRLTMLFSKVVFIWRTSSRRSLSTGEASMRSVARMPATRSANSAGSSECLASLPYINRLSVKCFSTTVAPRATAANEA